MDVSVNKLQPVKALDVRVTDDTLTVDLADGRTLSVPLAWYPRLLHGTPEERRNWRLIGDGVGIHWPDLDEDISIEGMLLGKRSGEKQDSLQRWLDARANQKKWISTVRPAMCAAHNPSEDREIPYVLRRRNK